MMSHFAAKPVRGFYNTLCGKTLSRCNTTQVREHVTCKACRIEMKAEQLAAALQASERRP